jgi:ubiquinone/menaquinone biosynthesis C-methylase UbiE
MRSKILQYGELAKYYDLLYKWKNYEKEARILFAIIQKYKKSQGISLLDVGCGTGRHIQYLQERYDCVGIDSSEQMLEQARHKVGGVEFVKADMRDFDLSRRFDVLLCLFGSIGYLLTYRDLKKTLNNFSRHLHAGGVAIIEPWLTKSTWKAGTVHLTTYTSDELKIARVGFSGIRGDISFLDEVIVVGEKGKGVSSYRDRQYLALFEQKEFLRLMREAGFKARHLMKSLTDKRGLYVGVKEESAEVL